MQDKLKVYVRERRDRPGREVDVRGGDCGRSRRQFCSEAEARVFAAEVKYIIRQKGALVDAPPPRQRIRVVK